MAPFSQLLIPVTQSGVSATQRQGGVRLGHLRRSLQLQRLILRSRARVCDRVTKKPGRVGGVVKVFWLRLCGSIPASILWNSGLGQVPMHNTDPCRPVLEVTGRECFRSGENGAMRCRLMKNMLALGTISQGMGA
ncbi:hypothetical protein SUGI_1504990 [Cryptomeria japonica]|uniref:Uncharacterized protein n=1 Tax=Cryptomeria japonica TaxID=3369 RepID=A0AAD3NMP0_CRYJA|nr:hypothetical protein SUGI_1222780 [Cryptomeria japonica]GLJ59362.1 hypothetical protein SUGI_1504990 [Cryptomeria japonica]